MRFRGRTRRFTGERATLAAAAIAAAIACAAQQPAAAKEAAGPAAAPAGAPKPKTDIRSLYPLAVGNQWTYKGTLLGQAQESRVTIVKNEGPVFIDDRGGRLMFDREGLRDAKRYLLKAPATTGTSWMSVTSLTSTERFEIVDDTRRAVVPAGTFEKCVFVRALNKIDARKDMVTEWTYAPGVGIVRIETFIQLSGRELVRQGLLELSAYSLR
jgi:hypothetical protein